MIFGYLIFFTATLLSFVAAYYSVTGLAAIFAAAAIPVIIMGSILELGKVVTTVWLHTNWHRVPRMFKYYLVPAVAFLMLLTSMGIFGFLSKAHLDQAVPTGDVAAQVAIYDEKIKTHKDNIDAARKALRQMDDSVDQLMGRSTDERGADKSVQLRRSQAKERQRLQNEIGQAQKEISKLQEERAPIASQLRKVEAEVGPIKYLAALIYGDTTDQTVLENAVRWVIILIVLVFDPLALVLILAGTKQIIWAREQKKDEEEHPPYYVADVGEKPTEEEALIDRDDPIGATQNEIPCEVHSELLEVKSTDTDLDWLAEQCENASKQDQDLDVKLSALNQQITELTDEKNAATAAVEALQSKLQTKEQELVELTAVASAVDRDYTEIVNRFEEQAQEAAKVKNELDLIQIQYAVLLEEKTKLQHDYDTIVDQFAQLMQQNSNLESAILELSEQLPADDTLLPEDDAQEQATVPLDMADVVDEQTTPSTGAVIEQSATIVEPELIIGPEPIVADNVETVDNTPNASFGTKFPTNPNKGDLYLRVDYLPSKLYKWNDVKWIEIDKAITDSYTYDEAYIKFLITKLAAGDYDTEDLSVSEQEQVTEYLKRTRRV